MDRQIIAAQGGVALTELTTDDWRVLEERTDHPFDVDADDRPAPQVDRFGVLGVVDADSGELFGNINWHAIPHGKTEACVAWNLGISLFPASRGRGVAVTATRLLAGHLFATTEVDRLEASSDRENVPAQRVLAKAGFHKEGVLRGAQLRGGVRRDMVAYSLLRADFEPAERTTLASRNGVTLATAIPADSRVLAERGDSAYDVDRDSRPIRQIPADSHRVAVLDTESGALLGQMSWHAVGYGPSAGCTAWNFGILLLPDVRARGVGPVAIRLLIEHLFATTEVDRVEASTDSENVRAQRALAKAGMRREGVIRGAQLRGGERRDMIGYAILRGDVAETAERKIVTSRDGIALATWLASDADELKAGADFAFDVDPDDRPALHFTFEVYRLAVVADDGTLVGQVNWHAVGYGRTAACTAWNIGIVLLPAARGRGAGVTAMRLLVEHLFATTEVDRVEASTDSENVRAQRAITKAGLRREGVIRGAQLRGGERHDMIGYGILRSDLAEVTEREIAASGEGIALATLLRSDQDRLRAEDDDAFSVDDDRRPKRFMPEVHRLAVLDRHTEELLGAVSWLAIGYGATAACEAWNLGIMLLPPARGRGAGGTALRLLAEYLFATTELDRIEASTDRENVPAQRALAKAGFRPEGLIRGAQLRGGHRRDMLSYSLLRTDVVEITENNVREVVVARDGIVLAEPGPGDREKFYVAGAGDFAIDPDDRPRVTGTVRSSLLSVLDASSGELLGGVSWHGVDYGGTVSSSAWNIGIGLLPAARGCGVGTLAQRLLVEHLFTTTELDRIEASTDIDNVAEQRALEKAGFRREGVLRGAQLRGGIRRDLVHYGLVRDDLAN